MMNDSPVFKDFILAFTAVDSDDSHGPRRFRAAIKTILAHDKRYQIGLGPEITEKYLHFRPTSRVATRFDPASTVEKVYEEDFGLKDMSAGKTSKKTGSKILKALASKQKSKVNGRARRRCSRVEHDSTENGKPKLKRTRTGKGKKGFGNRKHFKLR